MDELIQDQEPSNIAPLPYSFWQRMIYGVFMVIAPTFNFMFVGVMKPLWQSGKFSDRIYLILLSDASIWFFPLLAYSVISYLLILINEERFSRLFIVRFGVYTGMALSFHYSFLMVLTWEPSLSILAYVVVWMFPILIFKIRSGVADQWNLSFFVFLIVVSVFVLYFLTALTVGDFKLPFFMMLLLPAMAAPFWVFLIALHTAHWLLAHHETKLTSVRGFGILTWLSSYILALRFNILKMYELYAALPLQPPDCYIATAAASGHPRFVRSRFVTLSNGEQMWVNPQLQRLKLGELALQATLPRFHKTVRRMYDVIGKTLAHRIQYPLLADIAYLLLKPFEWISFQVLSWLTPEARQMVSKIYIDQSK